MIKDISQNTKKKNLKKMVSLVFFKHFATSTHCNFKFWKIDPPYCAYTAMGDPARQASLNHGTGTVLYGRGQLGSFRLKTSRLPAFSFLAVVILQYDLSWLIFKMTTTF